LRIEQAHLEVNYERCNEQQATDNTKPKQAIDEVWIDAQHGTGNHCGDFGLPLPVNKIGHSKDACDKSNKETIHVKLPKMPAQTTEP
jgi:hypothetical protein